MTALIKTIPVVIVTTATTYSTATERQYQHTTKFLHNCIGYTHTRVDLLLLQLENEIKESTLCTLIVFFTQFEISLCSRSSSV